MARFQIKTPGVTARTKTFLLPLYFTLFCPVLAQAEGPLFVTLTPLKGLIQKTVGTDFTVLSLLSPGQNEETFEPTPQQMTALSRSELFFRVGVPSEEAWIGRMEKANPKLTVVDLRRNIAPRNLDQPPGEKLLPGRDTHIWLDPLSLMEISRTVRDSVCAWKPQRCKEVTENSLRVVQDLKKLHEELQSKLKPYAHRKFMVVHPTWGYFAARYFLSQIPIESEGRETTPKTLARLLQYARDQKLKTIFGQPQFSSKGAEALARQIKARVVLLDPHAEDVGENLRSVTERLIEGWKSES